MYDRGYESSSLVTDLYQLTMLDAYYRLGMEDIAVFEFFVRRLPSTRNFLVVAGLEQVLDFLENLHFTADEIAWLRSTGLFTEICLRRLAEFRFTGSVEAMDEGTVCFADEPIVRVTAPLPEAQLVESRLINLLHFQTAVASKAARCRLTAGSARLVDFGMRRAHGAEAACLAARAAYLAGFDATATVEASRRFGIPVVGTMAHSFIQAHDVEREAFERFAHCRPQNVVLLIDTYDTEAAASMVAELVPCLRREGIAVRGVRIDSGELLDQTRRVRTILDRSGAQDIEILASGGLDEYAIAKLRAARAPIDVYCVGTKLSTVSDAPVLDCAYKLHQYAGKPRRKLSIGKRTWPGPRRVYRQYSLQGYIEVDQVTGDAAVIAGQPLLHRVMANGRRIYPSPPLATIRARCQRELATLPPAMRSLETACASPVDVSALQHALNEREPAGHDT